MRKSAPIVIFLGLSYGLSWLVPLVLVIVLLVTGQFRAPAPRDSELPAESASLAGSE